MKKATIQDFKPAAKNCHMGRVVNIGYYNKTEYTKACNSVVVLWAESNREVFYQIEDENIWEVLRDTADHNSIFYVVSPDPFCGHWLSVVDGIMRIV